MRTTLEERFATPAVSPLAGISCSIEMEPVQGLREHGGIRLIVEIANDTERDSEVVNPLDFLGSGITVTDAEGGLVALPRVVSRLFINTTSTAVRLPFRLDFAEFDGIAPLSEVAAAPTIRLAPHSRLRIGLTIDKTGNETAIDPGDYRVSITLRLAMPDGRHTRTFESPPLTVQLLLS